MAEFTFKVDAGKVADMLNQTRDIVERELLPAVEQLSISTHLFLLKHIKDKLKDDYRLPIMMGQDDRNIRWVAVGTGLWVVEIDDSVKWIEEGRPPTSMATEDWLLKPSTKGSGKWPKRAKDGSLYRPIPFVHSRKPGTLPETNKPGYRTMVQNELARMKIPQGIERNPDNTPKVGVLHKLQIQPPGPQSQFPGMYSKPRSAADAALSGLAPHGGIFHLKNAMVIQRPVGKKGNVVKETVVFRMVSTKHAAEGRWMYPKV
jgi:hypothetical protein